MRDELSRFILPASWLCRKTENLFVRVHGLCILSTPSAFPNPCSLMGTHCQPPHMTPSCNHTSNLYSICLHMLAWEKVIMKGKKGLILVKLCLAVFGCVWHHTKQLCVPCFKMIHSSFNCTVVKWCSQMTLRRLTLLGLFLNPTQPPSPTGAAIKGCPLLIQFNSRTGSFAFGTRSGFHSDPYHFVHCVVFCNPFHLCLELINLIGIFKIIFYYYAITVISIFPLCIPPPSTTHSLRQSPHHYSCP